MLKHFNLLGRTRKLWDSILGCPAKMLFKVFFIFRSFRNAVAYAKRVHVTEMVDTFTLALRKIYFFEINSKKQLF